MWPRVSRNRYKWYAISRLQLLTNLNRNSDNYIEFNVEIPKILYIVTYEAGISHFRGI